MATSASFPAGSASRSALRGSPRFGWIRTHAPRVAAAGPRVGAHRRQRPTRVTWPMSISKPSSARNASATADARASPISHVAPHSEQWRWPCSGAGRTWNSSRPSAPWPWRTSPSSSRTSRVRYTVDGMVAASRARQRSTRSAPVMCPSDAASTSITVLRCGVQRSPRSRSRSSTLLHGAEEESVDAHGRLVYYCDLLQ